MVKFVCILLTLLMTSGCCEVFGLCTSVNVHTSADSADKVASADVRGGMASPAPSLLQGSPRSILMPADAATAGNGLYFAPINDHRRTCS